jgi:hypothetical protein
MAVKSSPMRSATAVLPQATAITASVVVLRVLALLLLTMSTFGNYVTFVGGWAATSKAPGFFWSWSNLAASIAAINWSMVLLAIVYQVVFSLLQWGTKAKRVWSLYMLFLLASAIPSFLTYNGWAGPYLAEQVGVWIAGILVFIAAVGADAVPEWVLVA